MVIVEMDELRDVECIVFFLVVDWRNLIKRWFICEVCFMSKNVD